MHALEALATDRALDRLTVPSSVTAERFYARLGFTLLGERYEGAERILVMQRSLRAPR